MSATCSQHLFAKFKSIQQLNGRRGQGHLWHSKHKLLTRWLTETQTSVNQVSALWQSRKINIPLTGPLQTNQGAQTFMKAWGRTDRLYWFGLCTLTFLISLANFLNTSSWAVLHLFWSLGQKACVTVVHYLVLSYDFEEEQVQIMDPTAWYCQEHNCPVKALFLGSEPQH